MIVLPNGKTIINDKPTMMDLPKDTVIFNEEQTKKIMDNKVDASGNAYAGGTTDASQGLIPGFLPYQPTELDKKLAEVCLVAVDNMIKANQGIADEVSYENHKLAKEIMHNMVGDVSNNVKNISNITNNNNKNIQQPVVKQEFHITMPNVTNSTAAEELMNDLQSISRKKYQIDW